MYKSSFTLFEVIVSLVILALVSSCVKKLFVDNNALSIYYELQTLENDFISTQKVHNTQNIHFQTNP